jgi:hypothetical protein
MPDRRLAPACAGLLLLSAAIRGDDLFWPAQAPLLPQSALLPGGEGPAPDRPHRIRPFGFQTGFLASPVGLDDDPPTPDATPDDNADWAKVAMGNYNPFFDVRRPGDLGGVGYFRFHSQVQVVNTDSTGFALGLQALTPAGRDFDGLDTGPRVVTPSLGVFQALDDDGTALHGFLGKTMGLNQVGRGGPVQRGLEYGMALQRPVLPPGVVPGGDNLYFVLGTLGRYSIASPGQTPALDMLPGVHWQMGRNGFVAGSLVLPLTGAAPLRLDNGGWQLTFSLQF